MGSAPSFPSVSSYMLDPSHPSNNKPITWEGSGPSPESSGSSVPEQEDFRQYLRRLAVSAVQVLIEQLMREELEPRGANAPPHVKYVCQDTAGESQRHALNVLATVEGPEHFFAYNVEYLTRRTFVHGWLVGLGIQIMSQLQENDPVGIEAIMQQLGLPHSPRDNGLARTDVIHALQTLRERTIADDRWWGIIHQREITPDFIENVANSLEYAE